MLPSIKLSQVIQEMERVANGLPVPFSLMAVSASRRRPERSGTLVIFSNAILARNLKLIEGGKSYPISQLREFTPQSRKDIPNKRLRNSIRKLAILGPEGTYQFRNVHIRLILQFNGRKVIP